MLSRFLIFIFGLMAVMALYFSWSIDARYSFWIIPPAILTAAALVLAPQIDWWWAKQKQPRTDVQIVKLLESKMPFFHHSPSAVKMFLLHRIELFIRAFDWIPQGFETIPADAQYVVCAYSVQLTHLKEKFLFQNWEKLVFYKHPFPSPQYPRNLHNSEIFIEDRVVIFNIQALMAGFLDPNTHFPVGLYELGRVYCHSFKVNLTDALNTFSESDFEKISEKHWNWVTGGIGLESIDPDGLAVVGYYQFNEKMKIIRPDIFEKCAKEFGEIYKKMEIPKQ